MLSTGLIILLYLVGLLLMLSELAIPAHGLLILLGLSGIGAALVSCFYLNVWAGLGLLTITGIGLPLLGSWLVKVWPRTYIGRRLILQSAAGEKSPLPVQIGQIGVTISELRPMGECEFNDQRVEALSAYGLIQPGTRVKVIGLDNRRPIVEAVA